MDLNRFPLEDGDVVINIGAHRGRATKFYSSRVGVTGKVFSIEPEKNNYLALYHATKDLYNVWIRRLAIGESTGKGKLYVGTNSINHSTVREFDGETQEIQVITWDELVEELGVTEVTLAKVDVEGAEVQFLRGMTHTFPKHIIMEEHSRFAYDYTELADLLREKEYMFIREGIHVYATR